MNFFIWRHRIISVFNFLTFHVSLDTLITLTKYRISSSLSIPTRFYHFFVCVSTLLTSSRYLFLLFLLLIIKILVKTFQIYENHDFWALLEMNFIEFFVHNSTENKSKSLEVFNCLHWDLEVQLTTQQRARRRFFDSIFHKLKIFFLFFFMKRELVQFEIWEFESERGERQRERKERTKKLHNSLFLCFCRFCDHFFNFS